MAIQIRRGTDSEWESNKSNIVAGEPAVAMDSERMFVGTGSGTYMELANIDVLADAFDSSASYEVGDFTAYHGKVYKCNTPHSGAWNASDFDEVALADALDSLGEDVYTKSEADALLALKADASDVNSALALKADKADTYTKTEVNTALALKADKADTYTKAQVDTALNLKSDKADTYTKEQVDAIAEQIIRETEYSNFEMKSVSGDLIHITDGAGLIPVKDLKIGIEAVQDLHGYDAPWVGGAGKNKWHSDWALDNANTHKEDGVFIARVDIQSTYLLGTSDSNIDFVLPAGTYTLSAYSSTFGGIYATLSDNSEWHNGETKTFAEAARIINIRCNSTSISAGTYTWQLQIESGSEVTSYAPWENICPISGWTGAKVTRAGKNLFDIDNEVSISGSTMYGAKVHIPQGTTLYVERNGGTSASLYGLLADGTVESIVSVNTDNYKYTVTTLKDYYGVFLSSYARTLYKNNSGKLMVSIEDFTETEPYNGTTYSFTWQTEAGTVYGGTLDVTTGELVVTHWFTDMENLEWTKNGNAGQFYAASSVDLVHDPTGENLLCSMYKGGDAYNSVDMCVCVRSGSHDRVWVRDSLEANATAQEFTSYVNGGQLVCKLATPQTYQLTPTEVLTVLGENNIFADCGAIEELIYRISNQ